jgi:Bacterial EndoU nuclease
MAVVIDFIAETVGKLPTGLKLTAESIFLVLKKYISLLAQGTKSIIEFINNIFASILKWLLVVTGKIARQAFLLVLASGKRLACSIIPLEEIVILFSRIISARVKSNLGKLGVTVLESDGKYFVRYGGEIIFEGDKTSTEKFIANAFEKEESAAKIGLDDLLERALKRKNALKKWLGKFDKTFFNHLDGELGLETIELGFRKQEYIGLGQGGHNPNAFGESIRLKKGTVTIPDPPIDDLLFKCKIEVKYKGGEWVPKTAESTMFPKNWSKERIHEEVAFVYENTVNKGIGLSKTENGISQYIGNSTNGLKIKIEIKSDKIINSYPN